VDEVMIKLEYYLKKYPKVKFVSIGGGVSANKLLRQSLKTLPTKILLPEFQYTGDNAAMMAFYADLLIK
jgi:tRNA A37 threonylcarbamoyltransferase TsaD